jgi:hypothetical protein
VTDSHSLRYSFTSILQQSEVSPKVVQAVAWHSTITLMMDTYSNLRVFDERAAVEKLPELPGIGGKSEPSAAANVKTGTDGFPVERDESAYKRVYKEFAENAYPDRNRALAGSGLP